MSSCINNGLAIIHILLFLVLNWISRLIKLKGCGYTVYPIQSARALNLMLSCISSKAPSFFFINLYTTCYPEKSRKLINYTKILNI